MKNLVYLIVVVCCILIGGIFPCKTSSYPNQNCSMTSYLATVNDEIDSLSCAQYKIRSVVDVLDSNSTIYKIRSKQLEKISVAIQQLIQERDAIQKSGIAIPPVTIIPSPDGRMYSNGKRAVSCLGYRNSTLDYLPNGLYQIETENKVLTVYCDMNTAGGGWTMFAAIARGYSGSHFRVFDSTNAGASSNTSSFHIPSTELLARSTSIMAVCDSTTNVINNFYTSNWAYSTYCTITQAFRDKIYNPLTAADLATTCTIVNGISPANVPTIYTYGVSSNGHSIGFRLGKPFNYGLIGHAQGWTTLSYANDRIAGEGIWNNKEFFGLAYHFGGTSEVGDDNRNGALFLK